MIQVFRVATNNSYGFKCDNFEFLTLNKIWQLFDKYYWFQATSKTLYKCKLLYANGRRISQKVLYDLFEKKKKETHTYC